VLLQHVRRDHLGDDEQVAETNEDEKMEMMGMPAILRSGHEYSGGKMEKRKQESKAPISVVVVVVMEHSQR